MDLLLTDKDYVLQKFPGKGGWTYAAIPEAKRDTHAWFGWLKVKGSIDAYCFENYHLMPMENGMLFLPVKADIRKRIQKQEGDTVHIILYSQALPAVVEEDLQTCLQDEPKAWNAFCDLPEAAQLKLKKWILDTKNDQLKVERIAQLIDKLLREGE